MQQKKIAKLHMSHGRVITGLISEPISKDYYEIQVVKIENPLPNDWGDNDVVKISKVLVEKFEFKS